MSHSFSILCVNLFADTYSFSILVANSVAGTASSDGQSLVLEVWSCKYYAEIWHCFNELIFILNKLYVCLLHCSLVFLNRKVKCFFLQ